MLSLPPVDAPSIVVTASRAEQEAAQTAASVSLIDQQRIDRLGLPLVPDLLRLLPSTSVASSGPAGSQVQVRIRGAEANHSLLYIEGIRANDPAAGNEARFELLNADLASRIEMVRGPQSALWGSEAIGGVIAVDGTPLGTGGTHALVEYGSRDSWRAAARTEIGNADGGLSLGVAGQGSDGIDSYLGGGERDGYHNLAFRGAGRLELAAGVTLGVSGFALRGTSEFDGYDADFRRADTLDQTRNNLAAGRIYAQLGERDAAYLLASSSLLGSSNRNAVADIVINRTEARRRILAIEGGVPLGPGQLASALQDEFERFEARDVAYGGATDQRRSRRHRSFALEWSGQWIKGLTTGIAVRHDGFSRFKDATSLRASLLADLGRGFALAASYGEGIAQPSFFDLYGFFPGSFVGNPDLKPESSRGGELSLRYGSPTLTAGITLYRQRLRDEIIGTFDPGTFLSSTANASGRSRRSGAELELGWKPAANLNLTAVYAYAKASEPGAAGLQVKEPRRPRHSGSIAADGVVGKFTYGVAVAFTGERGDTDFDRFPALAVRLDPYWLASGQAAYALSRNIQAHVRVSNAFGSRYQDAIGYRTEGRSLHVGFRFAAGS
ncbi:TonB-dependent receptor domain-containing protein [Sphingomonas xanthus]|uniref:TonB-dependent receptor n=1 Tax=Sphingomonas xanthus TaxID=2594473 RepID=A0A516IP18_9SPHN|nr:TonB-dependent receptor [Sphingomonas xanthus]QDP18617.1 TonB-dependent receptor [Sphingomonas xanthus]